MLKVGLLGAGRIAGVHATAISSHPGSTLVAVSDINADAAGKLAAQYGAEARATDAIINDPAIDAVLIATSTDTHSDLIERATGAGKAVLCEKPVDLSLDRARACQKTAAATELLARIDATDAAASRLFVHLVAETAAIEASTFPPASRWVIDTGLISVEVSLSTS